MSKNQLFFTYDGIKWIASSYDMDSTFGMYWNGTRFVSATYRMQEDYESMTNSRQGNLLYMRMEQLFCDEIKARYADLRADVLSYANIVNEFERFMDTIGKDLYAEDLTIYTEIPSGNTNNIQQIRNYTRDRLTYVDTQIEALRELIPCTGIVLSSDTLSFTTTDTQTLSVVVSPINCTEAVTWSVSPTGIVSVNNGVVTPIANGSCTITATCGSYSDTCAVTVSGMSESGGGTEGGANPNLVFQVNSTSMNTADNTLIDNAAGISATLTGNPTVSDNQIVFTANDKFSFDISSLNLTNSNRTFRIKFTLNALDNQPRNVIGVGNSNAWTSMTTCYITSSQLRLQHARNNFSNVTIGSLISDIDTNRLSVPPITGKEYELVISENINGNVKWYIDGTLVQDGIIPLFSPLYLSNVEGNNRFIGSYSLIEIYNEYCNDYTEFTNMVNN